MSGANESADGFVGPSNPPTLFDAAAVWAQIGVLSFGGPAAQVALMHRILVEERRWLSERQYLNALSFCMLLPGPEAMQLATYAGWRLHGLWGGLLAGLLFVLPGAFVVLALAIIYAELGAVPIVAAVFFGIKAAVLVVVVEALLRVGRRALKGTEHWLLAAAAFAAIFVFATPYPLIIGAAALFGAWRLGAAAGADPADRPSVSLGASLRVALVWATIWIAPLAAVSITFGTHSVFAEIGWFFSKLAVVTFGGAYAVLAYMGQDVVGAYGWLTAGEMMDGLGLAETTPGPLILVTEFVGFLSAYRAGGEEALVAGLFGAAIAIWATFAPCFLWIFAFAPYIEWINAQPRLRGALAGITAAVVGVILNLAVWFAMHVLFAEVARVDLGPLKLWTPTLDTLDPDVTPFSHPAKTGIRRCSSVSPILRSAAYSAGVFQPKLECGRSRL